MNKKWLCSVAMFLVLGSRGIAQLPGQTPSQATYPAEMTIVLPEVEVRSGPTAKYYATGKLRMGDRVQVLRESKDQAGWLAIKPPQGSFSWIKAKFVKQLNSQTGYVPEDTAQVPVMPGSSLTNQTPNVESVRITAGTQVVILDRPFQVEGETWLPIQPPPTEVRFIPAEAVRLPSASPAVAVSSGGFPTSVGAAPSSLIDQGDQAYRSGNKDLARQLYQQAAAQATDPLVRTTAANRLASLGINNPMQNTTGWQPRYPNQPNPLMPATAVSASNTPATGVAQTQPPQWSGWGYLRQSSMNKDGQPVFVLENRQGQALVYAVPQQGTSLRDYLGRMVCLYGPITYRSEDWPRVQYMTASHVALP